MSFAMIFPGQGSQSVGMLAELGEVYTCIDETLSEASDALGFDLKGMIANGPEEALNQTVNTQPALLAAGVAVWRAWEEEGGSRPEAMAGHSLGEYTALVCGGSLDFADGLKLVAERGRQMQTAVPEGKGAMAAILGLKDDEILALCEEISNGGLVSAANFNAPGQVVIAGDKAAVERACELATERGARRAMPLAVSVPSHCALMRPAADAMREKLAEVDIASPRIPVIHNVDASTHSEPDEIREALIKQLYSPVRWTQSVLEMANQGIDTALECGPGRVLCGLIRRIDRSINCAGLERPQSMADRAEEL